MGCILGMPWMLMVLASTYAKLGELEEGIKCFVEAAQITEVPPSRGARAQSFLNSVPRSASATSGGVKASGPKPVISSRPFTTGVPKGSTRQSW
jgi:hypothetical protein